MLVSISLAFLFRLNKAIVILASNISIPPMWPLILYLSHLTGKFWMGDHATSLSFSREITLDVIQQNFVQYVYGAITLSLAAGVIFGALSFFLIKAFKRKVTQG